MTEIFSKLKANYGDRFYIEIQRHDDQNEKDKIEILNPLLLPKNL